MRGVIRLLTRLLTTSYYIAFVVVVAINQWLLSYGAALMLRIDKL